MQRKYSRDAVQKKDTGKYGAPAPNHKGYANDDKWDNGRRCP